MSQFKILLYLPALLGGGAERVFALLASEFAARGHDVIFAVDWAADENRDFLHKSVRVEVLPAGHLGATLGLARLLRKEKPDVTLSGIGVSNLKHMIAATLAGRLRRTMISFHAFFETENTGLLTTLGNGLTPLFTRLAGASVAVSEGLAQYIVKHKGAYAPKVKRIYNPVISAPKEAVPDAETLKARPPLVLYLGRFHPDKDVGLLLRAFAATTYPEARLLLAGDGPERPEYEALAASLGIAERVNFAGYIKDPGSVLLQGRVFAFSSRRESFGNVVAEALVYGLPVVVTAADGPAEIIDQGRFGTLVPVGDVQALARGIDAALEDPGDPAPRIAHARQFSVEVAANHYLALMHEVAGRAG